MEAIKPAIWVGCLAAYNNGRLHGRWIDLAKDLEDIEEEIQNILKSSPEPNAEEWEIMDTEYVTGNCLHEAKEQADFLIEHGELGQELLKYWCGHLEDAQRAIDEQYICEAASEEAYAMESFEDIYSEIPAYVMGFIDFERVTRDWFQHGTFYSVEVGGVCHIFDIEQG